MRKTNSDRTNENSVSVPFSSPRCPPSPHSPDGAGQGSLAVAAAAGAGKGRQRPSQVGGKVQGRTPLTVGVLVLSVVLRSRKTLAIGVQGPGPTAEKKQPLPPSLGRRTERVPPPTEGQSSTPPSVMEPSGPA